ncbi:M20/M25/M40 family metallo-hydrolase [Edaphocola aurantiacus]|uniref:M20/M25/M40 family metallo-hydrolase n=1 Tax=Edaphocola aurantiacus TaxID=2601682 RepID=UPI001C97A951|nr:M20/M25/M40 family metallo-hydrolase [Edaphocola aurantiacus]
MTGAPTQLMNDALQLLQYLIVIPSFSKEEQQTAACIMHWLQAKGIETKQAGNNIYARNLHFDERKPVILLNSHHDTVKPNPGYTRDPFQAVINDGCLYGLGSNDAGASLVCLISIFTAYYDRTDLPFNLVLAATAEEEISGSGGIELLLQDTAFREYTAYSQSWSAIVGEPTLMQLAVAERGLLVIDAYTEGVAGHAATQEGVNALYQAMDDINTLRVYQFDRVSPFLGPVQVSVTSIETSNKQHNVVPADCRFTIDVRVNELYSLEEVLHILQKQVRSRLQVRSLRLRATSIAEQHPLVQAGMRSGAMPYGSPTTSDKALMPFPALKMGPGDSARSHMADEFIFIDDLQKGIDGYHALLQNIIAYE